MWSLSCAFWFELVKSSLTCLCTWSGVIDNFLGKFFEERIHKSTAAANWTAVRCSAWIVVLSPWNHFFEWIPISESEVAFVILHLLSNYGDILVWNIKPLNSYLSNEWFIAFLKTPVNRSRHKMGTLKTKRWITILTQCIGRVLTNNGLFFFTGLVLNWSIKLINHFSGNVKISHFSSNSAIVITNWHLRWISILILIEMCAINFSVNPFFFIGVGFHFSFSVTIIRSFYLSFVWVITSEHHIAILFMLNPLEHFYVSNKFHGVRKWKTKWLIVAAHFRGGVSIDMY